MESSSSTAPRRWICLEGIYPAAPVNTESEVSSSTRQEPAKLATTQREPSAPSPLLPRFSGTQDPPANPFAVRHFTPPELNRSAAPEDVLDITPESSRPVSIRRNLWLENFGPTVSCDAVNKVTSGTGRDHQLNPLSVTPNDTDFSNLTDDEYVSYSPERPDYAAVSPSEEPPAPTLLSLITTGTQDPPANPFAVRHFTPPELNRSAAPEDVLDITPESSRPVSIRRNLWLENFGPTVSGDGVDEVISGTGQDPQLSHPNVTPNDNDFSYFTDDLTDDEYTYSRKEPNFFDTYVYSPVTPGTVTYRRPLGTIDPNLLPTTYTMERPADVIKKCVEVFWTAVYKSLTTDLAEGLSRR
ncbi:hypothetical protein quinque_015992 [Culex quinquefasciatus]